MLKWGLRRGEFQLLDKLHIHRNTLRYVQSLRGYELRARQSSDESAKSWPLREVRVKSMHTEEGLHMENLDSSLSKRDEDGAGTKPEVEGSHFSRNRKQKFQPER